MQFCQFDILLLLVVNHSQFAKMTSYCCWLLTILNLPRWHPIVAGNWILLVVNIGMSDFCALTNRLGFRWRARGLGHIYHSLDTSCAMTRTGIHIHGFTLRIYPNICWQNLNVFVSENKFFGVCRFIGKLLILPLHSW